MRKNYTGLNTNGERREKITGLTSEKFRDTLMNRNMMIRVRTRAPFY